ncbi:unnamed protein product [Jaminaea pallidilutea]
MIDPLSQRPNQRESRIGSIYEKYLYDPRDLDHPDPVIRALARQHSLKRQQHDSPNNNNSSNRSMTAQARKNRQSGVMFAAGTKDGASGAESNIPRSASTGSAYDGFGALMDEYSDDESSGDEDDVAPAPRADGSSSNAMMTPVIGAGASAEALLPGAEQQAPRHGDDWSARAMAVGQRPPDSASQNPPTLKLLALKSQREGGQPVGRSSPSPMTDQMRPSYQRERVASPALDSRASPVPRSFPPVRNPVQEQSVSEYGDNSSRVGSTIDFGGNSSDGFGRVTSVNRPPYPHLHVNDDPLRTSLQTPQDPRSQGRSDMSSRKALTAELGLATPMEDVSRANGYFEQPSHSTNGTVSLTRGPPSADSIGFFPSPQEQNGIVRQISTTSLDSMKQMSPTSTHSSEKKSPFDQTSSPDRALLVGPNGISGQNGSPIRSQGGAVPLHLPYSQNSNGLPSVFSPDGEHSAGQMPIPQPAMIGFSDAQRRPMQTQRENDRKSMLRRSIAFVTGAGPSAPSNSTNQIQPKRQSIFRRSMNLLGGKASGPPVQTERVAPSPSPQQPPQELESHPPVRVRGFGEEKQYPYGARKSMYLGGGGQGEEWDVGGAGANFWRRFNEAQKHASPNDKMEMSSRSWREKVTKRKKLATFVAVAGGLCIIGGVIGIVIWRENKESGNSSPGAINKGQFSGHTLQEGAAPSSTSNSGGSSSSNRKRRAAQASPVQTALSPALQSVLSGLKGSQQQDMWEGAKAGGAAATPLTSPGERRMQRKRHARIRAAMDQEE